MQNHSCSCGIFTKNPSPVSAVRLTMFCLTQWMGAISGPFHKYADLSLKINFLATGFSFSSASTSIFVIRSPSYPGQSIENCLSFLLPPSNRHRLWQDIEGLYSFIIQASNVWRERWIWIGKMWLFDEITQDFSLIWTPLASVHPTTGRKIRVSRFEPGPSDPPVIHMWDKSIILFPNSISRLSLGKSIPPVTGNPTSHSLNFCRIFGSLFVTDWL